jgi:sulfate adenylyltransferase subunit 2
MMSANNDYLTFLENEAIYVFREVAAQFARPVILFSGGKDSIVLVHLAKKAFYPARIPFPLLHIDTGHNFPEILDFRDELAREAGVELLVGSVQEAIDKGRVKEETGPYASRNTLQIVTLLDALKTYQVGAAIGGGRRDEEKARAKERFFSHRDAFGQWDPKNQRPELWNLFNGKKHPGEHFRVFPLSNWTELDVWTYIAREKIQLPPLYFSHSRQVFWRDKVLYGDMPFMVHLPGEEIFEAQVRFRTIGDATCTGAIFSEATTIQDVIEEVIAFRTTERGTRGDDKRSESAMEDRKRVGYF